MKKLREKGALRRRKRACTGERTIDTIGGKQSSDDEPQPHPSSESTTTAEGAPLRVNVDDSKKNNNNKKKNKGGANTMARYEIGFTHARATCQHAHRQYIWQT